MATTTKDVPLFGVSLDPERDVPFRLMSYGPRDPDTGRPRETIHHFTARADVDAGTALGTLHASQEAKAGVFTRFLKRALLDDDGVSVKAVPRPATDDDEPDDDEPGAELQLAGVAELVSPDTEWELEGKRFASRSLALQHARENGSSLRRFADLMDNEDGERVKITALEEIVKFLAKETSGRPTERSAPSPRRQTRKRR